MRPITINDLTPQFLQNKPFLLLDLYLSILHSLSHAIVRKAFNTSSIKEPAVEQLPLEVWLKIFALAAAQQEHKPNFF